MHRSTVFRCLYASLSKPGGRSPSRPRRRRWPTWSDWCGMTARIPRRRRWPRIARKEYARSARTARGRVRGLPGPVRGTRIRDITVSKAGACVTGLACGDGEGERSCTAVCGQVDLRAQAAAGASECVVGGLIAADRPLLRAPAACWWAGTTVESTDTVRSMSSSASAAARTAPRVASRVPSTAHLIGRLRAVWNEPSSSRRSRQGELVRYSHAMASRVRRWSAHRRPPPAGRIGRHQRLEPVPHPSVLTNRTGASDQPTRRSRRHALADAAAVDPGAVTSAGPAAVTTVRGRWYPLRTTRRRPCLSVSAANSVMY